MLCLFYPCNSLANFILRLNHWMFFIQVFCKNGFARYYSEIVWPRPWSVPTRFRYGFDFAHCIIVSVLSVWSSLWAHKYWIYFVYPNPMWNSICCRVTAIIIQNNSQQQLHRRRKMLDIFKHMSSLMKLHATITICGISVRFYLSVLFVCCMLHSKCCNTFPMESNSNCMTITCNVPPCVQRVFLSPFGMVQWKNKAAFHE